ncbi:hypothetical protein [Megamonas hypermegale]|uniref:DUF4468 domain-containing protein n=1 Tax=Megamonas hypermegale TaxID=158847 RepID=A0A921HLP2_9FIRM|nr:hypothetical protein [Megamonas hypermegale]MDM8142339.1 hypothetical protein [Megamonas hypermegale]HJF84156.1 hypothetical protein [Megamonas hypermegale]
MSRFILIGILLMTAFWAGPFNRAWAAEPFDPLPENEFQWVQATARSSYYFNKQAMTYEIGADGYADTNILLVPTVKLYDNMQVDDIIMKRQWRNLSTYRFNELVGAAEYLRIDLQKKTVEYTDCIYLDQGYNSLYAEYERPTQDMTTMSPRNVDYKFYQAILEYEQQHRKELLEKIADQVKPEDLKAAGIKVDKHKDKDKNKDKKERKSRE